MVPKSVPKIVEIFLIFRGMRCNLNAFRTKFQRISAYNYVRFLRCDIFLGNKESVF